MKSLYFKLFAFLISVQTLSAQEALIHTWANRMGGTGSDAGTDIKTDINGNVYTIGYFIGTSDFDPGTSVSNLTSAGLNDIFISKLDVDGNFVWAKSIGGTGDDHASSLFVDATGNFYLTGSFSATVDFDPGASVLSFTAAGQTDIFISKFDTNGNLLWAKRIGGSSVDVGTSIVMGSSGNLYFTGNYSGTVDFNPDAPVVNLVASGFNIGFISKFDSNGNFIWVKDFTGSSYSGPTALTTDNLENIISTGNFSGSNDFDPGAGTFSMTAVGIFGNSDIFVSKLDKDGNFIWAKQMGGTGQDYSVSIVADATGNVYTTGNFFTISDFDPGAATFSFDAGNSGFGDIFVSKLDSNGDFVWAKQMGGQGSDSDDRGLDLTLDNSGNLLITGKFNTSGDFDPGPGVFNLSTAGADGGDVFISKLDASGNFIWATRVGGSVSNGEDRGNAITINQLGSIYLTGFFSTTADFDVNACTFNLTVAGSRDIFVHKLNIGTSLIPTFSSFAPTFGPVGTTVTLTGTNFSTTLANNEVRFNGTLATVSSSTPTTITTTVPTGATTGKINITVNCTTVTRVQDFIVTSIALPNISSFTPTSGPIGTAVTITGTNFSTTPANNTVQFNGTTAVVTASTATSITTTVPAGATTGTITVTVGGNTTTSAANFIVGAAALPTISSFNPTSGPVGTTVTITGTNFSTTLINNIVYFGATLAVVTAATPTQLTVTVPVGATYQPISVSVNNLLAYSSEPFITTFAGGGIIDACSFAPKIDLTAGTFPVSIISGDFDGDGKADLAVANYDNNIISLFRNTSSIGAISYAPKIDITSGSNTDHISTDDLDGDGKLDLVVTDVGGASVYRNTSTGPGTISFAARINFATSSDPRHLGIDDFDKDGKPDLVVANYGAGVNTISVLRNTSSGPGNITYAAKVDFASTVRPSSVSAGDLDGDGKPDIAVVNQNSNTLSIFRNSSTGIGSISFAAKVDFTTEQNPLFVSIGDLDDDNKPELAIGYSLGNSVISVFRNLSSGVGNINFATKADFGLVSVPFSVHMGDLDGDGKPDLVATSVSSGSASIFRNTSSGIGNISFAAKVDFATNSNSQSVSITDFDGDGKPDLAATSFFGVHVLRNTISVAPAITSFTPANGAVGTTVIITGANFSLITANNIVSFNGTTAVVTASTATSITTAVPAGATSGTITVTVGCNAGTSSTNFTVAGAATNQPPQITTTSASVPIQGIITIDLEELISDPDNNLDPSTLQIITQPLSGAVASLNNFVLTIDYAGVEFSGTDQIEIGICDLTGICTQQELTLELAGEVEVFNALSPNGDGQNEFLFLRYIDLLPDTQNNMVSIFNRWGSKVFEVDNYNNTDRVFKGLNQSGNELPSGTYFYMIFFTSPNLTDSEKEKSGYLVLKR